MTTPQAQMIAFVTGLLRALYWIAQMLSTVLELPTVTITLMNLPSAASELALARTMSAFCAAAAFSFLPAQTRSTVCCSARP